MRPISTPHTDNKIHKESSLARKHSATDHTFADEHTEIEADEDQGSDDSEGARHSSLLAVFDVETPASRSSVFIASSSTHPSPPPPAPSLAPGSTAPPPAAVPSLPFSSSVQSLSSCENHLVPSKPSLTRGHSIMSGGGRPSADSYEPVERLHILEDRKSNEEGMGNNS